VVFELIYSFEPSVVVHHQEQFVTIFWGTCHVLISGNIYCCFAGSPLIMFDVLQ
jgi:hypothetical protein